MVWLKRDAVKGDPVHHAAVAGVIVEGQMLNGSVVPDRERARFPPESVDELGPTTVGVQLLE